MNQIKLIEEQQARIEEQERAIQYLLECPPSPLEFAKRSQVVNALLDEKPSETLAKAKVLSIYRSAPSVIGEMLSRHESKFKRRDYISRNFIEEFLQEMNKEVAVEDPMAGPKEDQR